MEQSLSEQQPRSLYQLAVNIGCVNEGYIQQKFPQLCSSIRQKIRKNNEERICTMERALADALTDESPPSLDDLRRRLGYSRSTVLKNHFPVLCNEILTRQRLHRRQMILERKKDPTVSALGCAGSLAGQFVQDIEHAGTCPRENVSPRACFDSSKISSRSRRRFSAPQRAASTRGSPNHAEAARAKVYARRSSR